MTISIQLRAVILQRKTLESQTPVYLARGPRDPDLKHRLQTGLEFLNHLLETIAWRGRFNLTAEYRTSGYSLMHVVAEDVGMTLGHAFGRLVQEHLAGGIDGSGFSVGVIHEAQVLVAVSMEGRPALHLTFQPAVRRHEQVEDMLSVDLENCLSACSQGALPTVHVDIRSGSDPHHTWEAAFRALGEAMNACLSANSYRTGTTPGVKGI